jgi:CBS domain-containing protein
VGSTAPTTVADVMTTAVVWVPPSMSVPEVASTLYTAAVRAVPVLGADGQLLGVISEADLLAGIADTEPAPHRWWRPRHVHRGVPAPRPGAITAGQLMSGALVVVDPGASVATAARLMYEEGVSWMPVLAEGRLVGVLGRSDLLAVLLRPDPSGAEVGQPDRAARQPAAVDRGGHGDDGDGARHVVGQRERR